MMATRRIVTAGAGLVALLALTASGATAAEPRLTQPVNATNANDEAPGHSYTSPGVVVDPDDPLKVYAGSVDVRSQRCVLLRSAAGGRTWAKSKEAPSPAAFPFCTHDSGLIPMSFVAMGRNHALYFLHTAWDTQDGGRSENRSVFLARSTDEGDTWVHTPVNINRGKTGNDIEKNLLLGLAVDSRGAQDIVYATYRASWPNPAAPAATRPGQAFVATSTDGGKTFAKSTDQGKTFTMAEALPADEDQLNPSGPTLAWGPGGGPAGTVHLVWEGKPKLTQGDRDILYRRSTDGGRTSGRTQMINDDDPAQLFSQHQPGLAIAPNGRVDVAWFDQRDGTGRYVTDVYASRSTDFGVRWSKNERITDIPTNRLIGMWTAGYALAAVTGITVVGLLLFGVSLVTRSRQAPPPVTQTGRAPAQVG